MGWLWNSLNSSIGKKFVMALTGILLMLFLVFHLGGNMTMYFGADAFDTYVHTLDKVKPIVRIVEIILSLIFIFHIFNGIKLWYENKKARPTKYKVNISSENSTLFSRTMIYSGSIVFIFLVLHLSTFWYAFNFSGHPVTGSHEYYKIVADWFQDPVYAGIYFLAMILLGFHLNHGFQSAFQTFGWNHTKYFSFIKAFGTAYAIIIASGFASLPVYFLFFYGGN